MTTMFSVNYQKRKNINLFAKFQTNKRISLSNVQNYIPIYDRFFSLNNTNYNSINLNHLWSISDIKEKDGEKSENIFNCKLKNISDIEDFTMTQKVFFKMAPLLDPFKYIVGKYNHTDEQLFNLPSFDKSIRIHSKIEDTNNSSYIDGFFCFLTSQMLNNHSFIHGVDYYGSFLAIKNNYKLNIIDDLDYLVTSEFFNKKQNVLFNVEDYSHLITDDDNDVKALKPLNILNGSQKSVLSAKSIDDTIFENIFEVNDSSLSHITLADVKHMNVELVDIMNSNEFNIMDQKKSETLKSGSTCSSRTSHTNENDNENSNENENENECDEDVICSGSGSGSGSDKCIDVDSDLSGDYSDIDEESLMLTIPQFPVQVICMENC
jgi:hypothetical protein